MSLQWIYKIAVRKDEFVRRQVDMFAPLTDD
ncbi:hypothetical protein [Pseudomonas sp. PDM25]|nr:hypothetical protein [Pseudomonas sp. PDM25]